MTITVKHQDEIPAALYGLEPGFTAINITTVANGMQIDVEYK